MVVTATCEDMNMKTSEISNENTVEQNRAIFNAECQREREARSGPGSLGWTRFDTWMEESRVLRWSVRIVAGTVLYGYAAVCVFGGLAVLVRLHNFTGLLIAGGMLYAGYYIGIAIPHKAKIERLKRFGR